MPRRTRSAQTPRKGTNKHHLFAPDLDRAAWRAVFEASSKEVDPPDPGPTPTSQAVRAVGLAIRKTRGVDAKSVQLAASLTSRFCGMSRFSSGVGPGRWDYFVDALNCYPHPHSTACRWLAPAFLNFIVEPRETPSELWDAWITDWKLSCEATSRKFAKLGNAERPLWTFLDYERAFQPPLSPTSFEHWRINAHLMVRPKTLGPLGPLPGIAAGRLNALIRVSTDFLRLEGRQVGNILDTCPKDFFVRFSESLRLFLMAEASNPGHSAKSRQRCRDSLEQLHSAIEKGLTKQFPLHLGERHVREYDRLLKQVQAAWKTTVSRSYSRQWAQRHMFLNDHGWDKAVAAELVRRRQPGELKPREAAALLLSMRERLGVGHPQTVLEALSSARKTLPGHRKGKPRGRPPRRK